MKLLIITQKVDIEDDNLSFFHRWIEKFAEKIDKVYVICLWEGKHNLPSNVRVYSLGKEKGWPKLIQLLRFYKYIWKLRKDYDIVFVHMNPIYVVLGGAFWKAQHKKIILWYVHKSLNWKLRLASKLVDEVLTASPESCRLKDRKKIHIVGHGIDTDLFKPLPSSSESRTQNIFRILSVGRIAPIKGQEVLVRAVDILVNKKGIRDVEVRFLGTPLDKRGKVYFGKLQSLVSGKKLGKYIKFLGGVPYNLMPKYYRESDLVINLSSTGSVDKVVLEAMASGCLVLTCNEAFFEILDKRYLFKAGDSQDLTDKIIELKHASRDENLREFVVNGYNLNKLINKIESRFTI